MSGYHNNSIFWVETEKIGPNPFQPRREFEPKALEDLADSIRQYGVLQPLVVTRQEILLPDNNGMDVQYELIAGERRLRASKIAGLQQVPVIIRKETDNKVKLELAIIENLQREDLNPIDRAMAFEQLHKEFGLTHVEIGKRMGKSRVYVSNSLRLLSLPPEIKQGLMERRISEGHTRPLLMLTDRPSEQTTLFKEIMVKKLSVRDAEKVARKIAQDKVRKKEFIVDPKIREFEKKLSENLGTRVHIEPKENGGQITIDYFTVKDLESIISSMKKVERESSMMDSYLKRNDEKQQHDLERTTGLSFQTPHVNFVPEKKLDFDLDGDQEEEIFADDEDIFEEDIEKENIPIVETYERKEEYSPIFQNQEKEINQVLPVEIPLSLESEPTIKQQEHIVQEDIPPSTSTEKYFYEPDVSEKNESSYEKYSTQEEIQEPIVTYDKIPITSRESYAQSNNNSGQVPSSPIPQRVDHQNEDTCHHQQYYQQHQQQQQYQPKKKSFLGKLFG